MMDLGSLRASFHCIVRPTVAGCTMLLLALLLIACLQSDEKMLEKAAAGRFLIQGVSFTTLLNIDNEEIRAERTGQLEHLMSVALAEGETHEFRMQNKSSTAAGTHPKDNAEEDRGVADFDVTVPDGPLEERSMEALQGEGSAGNSEDTVVEEQAVQLPWVDQAVPYQWEQCGRKGHELGKATCVYGPGARGAKVMEPTYFFINVFNWKDNCYARMTGPAIFVVKMKFEGLHILRGSYTAHEPGEYQLWISCKTSHANGTVRALPPNSKFVPWHHHELIAESPIPVTVLPNPKVAPRGCQPCTGPDVGTLGGQWISKGVLADECGLTAVGAVEEWHDDEHVWVPRQCTLPFFSREEFGRRFAGADLLLMGDSTVSSTKGPLSEVTSKGEST